MLCDLSEFSINWPILGNFLLAFAIGSFYGFTELLSRYQRFDNIWKLRAGKAYIIFNGMMSGAVFCMMEYGKLRIILGGYQSGEFTKVILAGTAAMLVLRSSVANLKLNGKDVQIGLAPILQVFLNAVNREYDRNDALTVLSDVTTIMKGIDFVQAERNLPFLSEYLMKSLSNEESEFIGKSVSEISNNLDSDNDAKVIALGLLLAQYTGIELLRTIVNNLRERLLRDENVNTPIQVLLNNYNITP